MPGTTDIASGGIVAIAAGVTAPNNVFSSTPTFHDGAILKLGAGASFSQNITVVS